LAAIKVARSCQTVLEPMVELVKEELNIKELEYIDNPDEYVSYTVKPNFPVLGPKYGKLLQGIGATLSQGDTASLVKTLRENGVITLEVNGASVTLTQDDVEVRTEDKQGFVMEMDHGRYVILDIRLTKQLIEEGLAREIVSKVQNMRKSAGFELTDRICLEYLADDEVASAVKNFEDYIKSEVLAVAIKRRQETDTSFEKWDINGHPAELKVIKEN
jgi:isoleucyl-tRNA synthetase